MSNISITEWVGKFNNGDYSAKDTHTQIEAGWYDWFCGDWELADKTEYLGNSFMTILGSKKFDNDRTYIWFKNNCPVIGPLYDDFRIADLETDDVIYTVQHLEQGSHGCEEAHWEVYGRENHFEAPLANGSWADVRKYFLS